MNNYKKYLPYIEHFFLAGIIVFLIWTNFGNQDSENNESGNNAKEIRQSGYRFINPLMECEISGENALKKYIPFEKETKKSIQEQVSDKNEDISLSVYFRNLNNGPWFGINEKENFSPASLLKVPIMITYFKEFEDKPEFSKKEVTFQKKGEDLFDQEIVFGSMLENGKSYTMEDLVFRMIVNSDNSAMNLLLENISPDKITQVHIDLGVALPGSENTENYITVKDYASFFRILYNGAYLNKQMSEKALMFLSKVQYKEGIISGVKGDIVVAHKFGERTIREKGMEKKQLHDCGIIYYEKYPYLLCVMTRGNDYKKLSNIIAQVSKITFEEISKNFSMNDK